MNFSYIGFSIGFKNNSVRRISTDFFNFNNDEKVLYLVELKNNKLFDRKLFNDREYFFFRSDDFLVENNDILLFNDNGYSLKLFDSSSNENFFIITNKCNCHCLCCPQPQKLTESFDWIKITKDCIRLILKQPNYIGITGGEPTLEFENLLDILVLGKKYIPDSTFHILSNGVVFKDQKKANFLKNANSNIVLGIAIHSDVDEIHDKIVGLPGAFWSTISGLYNLSQYDIFIELRIIISKINYMRLPNISKYIYFNLPFINNVVFMALEPIGHARENVNDLWISPLDYKKELLEAVDVLLQRGMSVSIFNHPLCLIEDKLIKYAVKSISTWKVRYLDICSECPLKLDCGGMFFSSFYLLKDSIKRSFYEKI